MFAFEGDFSAFNRRINPSDLFLSTRVLFTELMGENCVLNRILKIVEDSFSVKFLTMPFRMLSDVIEAYYDRKTVFINELNEQTGDAFPEEVIEQLIE